MNGETETSEVQYAISINGDIYPNLAENHVRDMVERAKDIEGVVAKIFVRVVKTITTDWTEL